MGIALGGFLVFQIIMIVMCVITNAFTWMYVSISLDVTAMPVFLIGLATGFLDDRTT